MIGQKMLGHALKHHENRTIIPHLGVQDGVMRFTALATDVASEAGPQTVNGFCPSNAALCAPVRNNFGVWSGGIRRTIAR